MANVSFIGLGVMGYPMAGHLSNAGHQVFVFNRTKERAKKWVNEHNGQICKSPKDAAIKSANLIIDISSSLPIFIG